MYSSLSSKSLDVSFTMHTVVQCKLAQRALVAEYPTTDLAYCCELNLWKRTFHTKLVMIEIDASPKSH